MDFQYCSGMCYATADKIYEHICSKISFFGCSHQKKCSLIFALTMVQHSHRDCSQLTDHMNKYATTDRNELCTYYCGSFIVTLCLGQV
jgi:hypothetical protein